METIDIQLAEAILVSMVLAFIAVCAKKFAAFVFRSFK